MNTYPIIISDREAKSAREIIKEINETLAKAILPELVAELTNTYKAALKVHQKELAIALDVFEKAKKGDATELIERAENHPGLWPIIRRIAKGYSQKELARQLGLKEQQIQRYEATCYSSISLSNYCRVARALNFKLQISMENEIDQLIKKYSHSEKRKILKHAREHNWFEEELDISNDEESTMCLHQYISDHLLQQGSPSLLRTGLNTETLEDDLSLLVWKARITKQAEKIIANLDNTFSNLSLSWISNLVNLSVYNDGPLRAKNYLFQHGIVLIAEPQIPGLNLDGAAFVVNNTPVIGVTLRRDTIDNFWFTLLHELGHVVLHQNSGLNMGFFDIDINRPSINELEEQANVFASNYLIQDEVWENSPARITKSTAPVENLAKELGIHPAIIYGRIRYERDEYRIFTKQIGNGKVRKWLFNPE